MSFTLPALPYSFGALEPHIDARTMEIHHGKHHNAYVTNLNAAVDSQDSLKGKSLDSLIASINALPEAVRGAVRNNGGGHWNHTFFWEIMTAGSSGKPVGKLAAAIDKSFGSFDAMKEQFNKAAATRFGSGWAWLVKDGDTLKIGSTPNQDNPLMDISDIKGTPIIGLDVWEHAYYLHYQNRRPDYVGAWWNVVNWEKAEALYVG